MGIKTKKNVQPKKNVCPQIFSLVYFTVTIVTIVTTFATVTTVPLCPFYHYHYNLNYQKRFLSDNSIPITTVISVTSITCFNSVTSVHTDYTVSVLGQDEVYTVKYSPLPEGVPKGEA